MTTIASIIARAGSKGLKNKAMLKLGGKPLVAWTIEHALQSKRLDGVVLSSDGDDILDVGRSYGIEVYKRPGSRAADTSLAAVIAPLIRRHLSWAGAAARRPKSATARTP